MMGKVWSVGRMTVVVVRQPRCTSVGIFCLAAPVVAAQPPVE